MKYPRYPKYKDSGVEWLGEIPEGWEAKRIGYHFIDRREKVNDTEYPALSVTMHGIVPQMEHVAKTEDNDNRKLVKAGDIVINSRSDRKGASGLSRFDGSVSLINTVLIPDNYIYGWFVHHVIRSEAFQEEYYRYGKGIVADLWSTNYSEMKNIQIPLPPLLTQRTIATFLDSETIKIDGLIKDYEELIALLQEKRQSLISHAVTRGLSELVSPVDPEFGKWAAQNRAQPIKFKYSGIEWLGEIPAEWGTKKLKNCTKTSLNYGANESGEDFVEGHLRYIRITDIIDTKTLYETDIKSLSPEIATQYSLIPGDILLARSGATVGKSFQYQEKHGSCCYAGYLILCRPNDTIINSSFLLFILQSHYYWKYISGMSIQATIQNVSAEKYGNLPIPTPTTLEQQSIAAFLDRETAKIDMLVTETESSISLLKEHRSALITNAVTGKINVEGLVTAK